WQTYFSNHDAVLFANAVLNFQKQPCGKHELLQFISSTALPETLLDFIVECNTLNKMSREKLNDTAIIQEYTLDNNLSRCIKQKKRHEVSRFSHLIINTAKQLNCHTILDIGAGLGYLGQVLTHYDSSLNVIGFEMSNAHVQSADNRNKKITCVNDRNYLRTVEINNEMTDDKLLEIVHDTLNRDSDDNFILSSLHACGDLTPTMLKLYVKSKFIRGLLNVSCCYHTMNYSDEGFFNIPLSRTLKQIISQYQNFTMTLYGLRLAIQETHEQWYEKSDSKLKQHMRNTIYRGILECILVENNYHLEHRKQVYVKSDSMTFDDYCHLAIQHLKRLLFFTILQCLLQPVLELFVLNDRLVYLLENNLNAKLCQIFDETISPRCWCLISEKEC
ncbi:unnamed protein product, partial [Didymodactylos carnosus]